jgi:hypothetical protein
MIRHIGTWSAIGALIPIVLIALDRFAPNIINSWPFGLLFLAWPTAFLMLIAPRDLLGVGVAAFSTALNAAIYAALGRIVWAVRHRSTSN